MSDETFRETAKQDFAKGEKWISPQEAAEQLGISIRAVQIRAQKGTLSSKREDRKLYVCLDALEDTPPRKADETFREMAKEGETPDETPFAALVDHQAEEIAFLRARIEEHEAEIRRRDVAESEFRRLLLSRDVDIGRLQERVQMLLAAPIEDAEAPPASQTATEPLNAAETRQEHGKAAGDGQEAPQTQRRVWWKFWERKE